MKKRRHFTHNDFPAMAPLLAPAEQGVAKLDHFTITTQDAELYNLGSAFRRGGHLARVEPGTYARLHVDGALMMTDTPMEKRTNWSVGHHANGRVLIGGLGLGMITQAILRKPDVTHVTVVEKYADVVALIAPSLAKFKRKLTIIEADIFDWAPPKGERWDVIYFDIWPDVCTDNLVDMARLSRKFSQRLNRENPLHWMESWRQRELQAQAREERRGFGW